MSRRTTKQRRAARRRRFRVHVIRCKRLVAEVGPWNILAALVAVWEDDPAAATKAEGGGAR